jgi:hypothetical protein
MRGRTLAEADVDGGGRGNTWASGTGICILSTSLPGPAIESVYLLGGSSFLPLRLSLLRATGS